jgi:hypothetical protein
VLRDDQKKRILKTIEQTPYYDLKGNPHRYYVVDKFEPTDAKKTSPQGIMGMRYLDLSDLISDYDSRRDYSTKELASLLQGATWE